MSSKSTNCCPLLSVALKVAKDDPHGPKVTRATIADALQISETQAGRVLDGTLDDDVANYNHALQSSLGPIFAGPLLCNTAYPLVRNDATGDVNGDGKVDMRDIAVGGIEALQHVTGLLRDVQDVSQARSLTPKQQGELNAAALKAIDVLTQVMAAGTKLTLSGGAMRVA